MRFNGKKSTVTDRNVKYSEENENCQVISQVRCLLSDVEKSLSSVCRKMALVNVDTRKKILPNVAQILYQVETLVSSSSQPLDTATDLWWDESGVHLEQESYGWDDSHLSDVFLFSDARSTSSTPSRSSTTRGSSRTSSSRDSSMSSSSRDSSMSSSSRESSMSSSTRESSRSSPSRGSSKSSSTRESSRSSSMRKLSRSSSVESSISSEVELSRSSEVASSSSFSDISSDSNTFGEHNLSEWGFSDCEQDFQELEDEILFESILQVIDIVAPNNVFNRGKSDRRRRKKVRKRLKATVTPHLFSMWQNADDLVCPRESVAKPTVEVMSPYPIIDMSKVNTRFLSNLPTPERFPVLGCSQDPKFYEPRYEAQNDGSRRKLISSYEKEKYPFGCDFGFMTNLGIIHSSSREGAVHGYIWSGYSWVLHAQRPQDRERDKQKVAGDSNFKKKHKRKKESR